MKISIAQFKSRIGDINHNISQHCKFIDSAVNNNSDLIIFPELSLMGYEPALANELAMYPTDPSLTIFQEISNEGNIIIGIGMAVRVNHSVFISMLLFHPGAPLQIYSKQFLHPDEETYFSRGQNDTILINNTNIALAICYELSVKDHAKIAFENDASIYVTSVAKTQDGVDSAIKRLNEITNNYSMITMMSNCVGICDGVDCVGNSFIMNKNLQIIDQFDNTSEGILSYDTNSQALTKLIL